MGKILRVKIRCRKVFQDLTICSRISLMHLHHSGENIPLFRKRKALHRLKAREGLEAELGKITEMVLSVNR